MAGKSNMMAVQDPLDARYPTIVYNQMQEDDKLRKASLRTSGAAPQSSASDSHTDTNTSDQSLPEPLSIA